MNNSGWARAEFSETDDGATRITFFDFAGSPTVTRSGYHTMVLKNASESEGALRFYDFFGKPFKPFIENVLMLKLRYDSKGHVIEQRSQGLKGTPMAHYSDGYYIQKFKRNEAGEVIEKTYFDVAEKAHTLWQENYHQIKYERDAKGTIKSLSYFDRENKPALMTEVGCHKISFQFNENLNPTQKSCFDTAGKTAKFAGEKAHLIKYAYNERGYKIEEARFDEKGKPAADGSKIHKIKQEFNAEGFLTAEYFLDVADKPKMSLSLLYQKKNLTHSKAYLPLSENYFADEGNAVQPPDKGYHARSQKFNARGNVLERKFLDHKNKAMINSLAGCHIIRSTYNKSGMLTARSCLDTAEKPAHFKDKSYHREEAVYDETGRRSIEVAYFDKKNKPATDKEGQWHKRKLKPDNFNNTLEESYFGKDGKAHEHAKSGCHRFVYKYDSNGNPASQKCFDKKGELKDRVGIFELVFGVSDTFCLTSLKFMGKDGKPATRTFDKVHRFEISCHPSGQRYKTIYYDLKDKKTIGNALFDAAEEHMELDPATGKYSRSVMYNATGKKVWDNKF